MLKRCTGEMAPLVKCFTCKREDPSSDPQHLFKKAGVVEHACGTSAGEVGSRHLPASQSTPVGCFQATHPKQSRKEVRDKQTPQSGGASPTSALWLLCSLPGTQHEGEDLGRASHAICGPLSLVGDVCLLLSSPASPLSGYVGQPGCRTHSSALHSHTTCTLIPFRPALRWGRWAVRAGDAGVCGDSDGPPAAY